MKTIVFQMADLERTYKSLDKAGLAPQKAVNKGTSKAAVIVKRAVKAEAPFKDGALKRNIVTKAERSRYKGKKVRETTIRGGAEANAIFQKPINNPGVLGGKSPKAYYPSSMEYGFLARANSGGVVYYHKGIKDFRTLKGVKLNKAPSKKVDGAHYMLRGAENASEAAKAAMIETIEKELDKIWKEK